MGSEPTVRKTRRSAVEARRGRRGAGRERVMAFLNGVDLEPPA
jgi:hypothetical protein